MYPLYGPPPRPGLYFIKNRKTHQIYVGQTVDLGRRYNEWRSAISTYLRLPNHVVEAAFKSSDRDDWVFEVLAECPASDLKKNEEKAITRLVTKVGPLCLNVPDAGVRKPKSASQPGNLPLSEVLDEHGAVMPYARVAERLGISMNSIQKRLRNLRKAGHFKIRIDELPPRQHYRIKYVADPKNSGT